MNRLMNNLTKDINNKIDKSRWEKWKFSDLVENIVEKVVPQKSGLDRYIGLEHLDTGSLKINRYGETSSIKGDKLKIYKNDIIFAKRNAYLKRVAVADFDAVASAHSLVLRPKANVVLPEFLAFFMLSEVFWRKAIEISVGSLSPTINWRVLAKQEFLLPPKDKQRELCLLFSELSEVVEKNFALRHSLKQFYNTILKEKVELANSNEFEVISLNSVIDIKHGFPFKSEFWEEDDGNLPIAVAIGNYDYEGGFRFDKTKIKCYSGPYPEDYNLFPGDLLLAMTCQTPGGEILGIPGVISNDGRQYLHNQRIGKVELKAQSKVSLEYLYLLFLTNHFRQFVFSSASGTKVLHTSPDKMLKYKFKLPDPDYQDRIVAQTTAISNAIKESQHKLQTSQKLLHSLINGVI